jgi:ribonuclease D
LTEEVSLEPEVELPIRRESVAPVYYVEQASELLGAIDSLSKGSGPLAIDAERASGFKYGNKAYLIQVYRNDSDIFLIDPIPLAELEEWAAFSSFCNGLPWILHAATQDLGCLAEIGLVPIQLIDTELGSRILGLPRVGLGAACEQLLGFRLAKEHSAADWSVRPIPNSWLNYAALDVDVLPELASVLMEQLAKTRKAEWATQEFQNLLSFKPKPQSPDKWRAMSGLHEVKDARRLAVAREIWVAREGLAEKLDVSPGRLVPDSSIVALAKSSVASRSELASFSAFHGRASRTYLDTWWEAYSHGQSTKDVPDLKVPNAGIPNHRSWPARYPEADERLKLLRPVIAAIAEAEELPLENLLQPDLLRRVAWQPEDDLRQQLVSLGARPWQVELVSEKLSDALRPKD